MSVDVEHRFEFRYDRWCGWLLGVMGHGRRLSRVVVHPMHVDVRMGLAFRARIERTSIVSVERVDTRVFAWGVHGWRGRWLVNGSSHGLVTMVMQQPVTTRVMGLPVRVRELTLSLVEPDAFVATVVPATAPVPSA